MRQTHTAFLFCSMLAFAAPASAFSVRISPIGVDLAPNERAQSLTITNIDSETSNMQVRIFKWTQVDGQDHLEPTTEIAISPPFLAVPAGKSYTVRVVRAAVQPEAGEASYRLFVDEIPKPATPGSQDQSVRMVLRASMPVFVTNKSARADLSWRIWQDKDGLHAEARNSGLRHAKISALTLHRANGQTIRMSEGLAGYVLGGAIRRFDLKATDGFPRLVAGEKLSITAQNDSMTIQGQALAETR